jgi:hypothetical protein
MLALHCTQPYAFCAGIHKFLWLSSRSKRVLEQKGNGPAAILPGACGGSVAHRPTIYGMESRTVQGRMPDVYLTISI